MIWQEIVVAVIVALAVVSLYRHIRGMLGGGQPGAKPSCHGCDDCGDEPVAPSAPGTTTVPSTHVTK